jgi:hypothetical protein
MRRSLLTAVVAAVAAAGFGAGLGLGAGRHDAVRLRAKLDARHETPAPTGAARASGLFTATLSARSLTWKLTFSHLTGKALSAHIHLGRPGVAGPVAVPLCGPCQSGVHGKLIVTVKVRAALLAGTAYVNVHTARNRAGEIRGQVTESKAATLSTTTTATTTAPTTTGYGY